MSDKQIISLYEEGLNAKNAGNYERAIAIWKKILECDFNNLVSINAIACAYAETGRLGKAKTYIDRAMRIGGTQADYVLNNLAGILSDMGRYAEAEAILKGVEQHREVVINNLTRVLCAQGKIEEALTEIETFFHENYGRMTNSSQSDENIREMFSRGLGCIMEIDCSPLEAIRFLTTYGRSVKDSSPKEWSAACFDLGVHFLQEKNDGVHALLCLNEALEGDPDDSEANEARMDACLLVVERLKKKVSFQREIKIQITDEGN